jgi:hypothetical protein
VTRVLIASCALAVFVSGTMLACEILTPAQRYRDADFNPYKVETIFQVKCGCKVCDVIRFFDAGKYNYITVEHAPAPQYTPDIEEPEDYEAEDGGNVPVELPLNEGGKEGSKDGVDL